MFLEICTLKNFANFTGKQLLESLFNNVIGKVFFQISQENARVAFFFNKVSDLKACNLIKKRL